MKNVFIWTTYCLIPSSLVCYTPDSRELQLMAGKPRTTSAPRSSSDEKTTPHFQEKTQNLWFQNWFSDPSNQNLTYNVQLFHPLGRAKNYTTKGWVWGKKTPKQQPTNQISKRERGKPLCLLWISWWTVSLLIPEGTLLGELCASQLSWNRPGNIHLDLLLIDLCNYSFCNSIY